ncbi:hypothetical protein [Conexibacter woesei]|nr:hypothetical protein [Conexibacter woesei]
MVLLAEDLAGRALPDQREQHDRAEDQPGVEEDRGVRHGGVAI